MNQPWLFALLSLGQFMLAIKLAFTATSNHASIAFLAAMIAAGLGFDNSVLALGQPLLEQRKLLAMSHARYLLHALVTPLLLPLALSTAQTGGLQLPSGIMVLAWILTAAWMLSAWTFGYNTLDLELVQQGSTVRHHNKSRNGQPWLRLLLVGVVVVILLLGSMAPSSITRILMLTGGGAMLAGALASRKLGLSAANLGELVLMGALSKALFL
jgi:hypothetical protein